MARIRTVKPQFFTSLTVAGLAKPTRLTFIGLWTHADDDGRAVDDARVVKGAVWPLDDDYPARKVEADLDALAHAGLIHRYEIAGRRYLHVVGWREHQRVNRRTPSKLPACSHCLPRLTERSLSDHGEDSDDARSGHRGLTHASPREGNREGNREQGTEPPIVSTGFDAVADEPVDDDRELDALWWGLAEHDLERRNDALGTEPGHRHAWLRAAAENRRRLHGAEVAQLLAARTGWTFRSLAAVLLQGRDPLRSGALAAADAATKKAHARSLAELYADMPLDEDDVRWLLVDELGEGVLANHALDEWRQARSRAAHRRDDQEVALS